MSTNTLYGGLTKEAAFNDYLQAAGRGANIGTNNRSWLMNPIDATKGAVKGVLGHVAQNETSGLRQQGVAFNQDPYGRIQNVNVGDSIKGFANNLFNSAKAGINNLQQNPQTQGMGNLLHAAGNFINQYKWPLLGGIGAIGGGYLLKNLLFPGRPKPRYGMPRPYTGAGFMPPVAPGAFEKAGMLGALPSPMQMPQTAAEIVSNSLDIPGLSGDMKDQSMFKQEPYQPRFTTSDPRLKKTLQDPRMRQYLQNLIQQIDSNRSSSNV